MDRVRLFGAAAGAVFAVVIVAAFAIAPGPSSAGDVKVVEYYTQHGNAAIWQAVLAGFGLVCFVWFAAVFSGWSPAGPAVLVSAGAIAALYCVTLGSWESLGENFKAVDVTEVSSETYRDAHFLYDVGVGAAHMALFMQAAFVGATTAAMFTTAVPRRRLGAVGAALTLVVLINAPLQLFGTADGRMLSARSSFSACSRGSSFSASCLSARCDVTPLLLAAHGRANAAERS